MNIRTLVETLVQAEGFTQLINNPMAQFGTDQRAYLGATLLPEVTKPENAYIEEAIKYRTVIANDGTRYSPVQKKGGTLIGSFQVILGNQDIGSEFTGQDYDALIRLIERTTQREGLEGGGVTRPEMMAMMNLMKFTDMTLSRPLLEKIEKQRWEALIGAQVTRQGDGGYTEIVKYPNPLGHRVSAGGTWSNNSYDLYQDIMAGLEFLATKGYAINKIVMSQDVRHIMALNAKMVNRVGKIVVQQSTNGLINQPAGRVTMAEINGLFGTDGLPAAQTYDMQFRTQTGSGYFLPRGTFAMFCTTGRDQQIDRADLEPLVVQETLGYVGVGRAAGQATPGRKVVLTPWDNKPPRVEGEAWQTSLPVLTEPEALYIISGIA